MSQQNNNNNLSGSTLKDFLLTNNVKSKSDIEYGKKVAVIISGYVKGNTGYFFDRNARFRKNRQLANGRYDMSYFMDRLEMNGKFNYVNINWKAPAIVNTAISRKVGQWMGRREKIEVSAIDPISSEKKNEAALQAEFVLDNKEMLAELEDKSGVAMIPKNSFVPEDKDDLDQWVSEFNRLPEEIKYELGVNNILDSNGWFGVSKEQQLHDSATVGLIGTYTYMDGNGEVHVDRLIPENIFYSYSIFPDFRDTTWRGHVFSMKVSELRAKYGKEFGGNLTEEEIWTIAQTSKNYQLSDKLTWIDQWTLSFLRPYDEWNIDCMRFEIKTVDSDIYTVTKTKLSGSTIINKGMPKTSTGKVRDKVLDNQKIVEDKKWNIYEGVFVFNNCKMLEWGIKKNMIRPQDPKELGDAEFSYSFYMYQNYEMRNLAIPEKIEEPVEQMILARLKIQVLVAKMAPAGYAIDVDALQELDLGLANMVKPLDAQKIHEQTGRLYYRGKDAEGNPIPLPIKELANAGFVPQLQALIQLYQFHYQVLKDELGDDPNLSQQASRPRVTEGNIQTAIQQSDDATDYMYDAYSYCMKETAKKIACLLNASVTYQSNVYRHILKEDEVKGRVFQTEFKMLPTDQQVAELQMLINNAIATNPKLIVYLDPFKIIRIAKDNVKLAELYFRQAQKKYIKTEQEIAQQNSIQNAQIQQASQQAASEGESALEDKKAQAKERLALLQMFSDLYKSGLPIPEDFKPLVPALVKNIGVPLAIENMQVESQIQQSMQQEQQNVSENRNQEMDQQTQNQQQPIIEQQ
mgnify:CR=1 FL=1